MRYFPPCPLSAPVMPIGNPAIPEVIYGTQDFGRHLDDQWSLVGVNPNEAVNGIVVRCQFNGLWVDQSLPNDIRLIIRPQFSQQVCIPTWFTIGNASR